MEAVDSAREKGQKVGLVRLRLLRPFPFDDLKKAVGNVKVLGVMDRAVSFGGPIGPVASEIKSAFYQPKQRPDVVEFLVGLGGRTIPCRTSRMFDRVGRRPVKGRSDSRTHFHWPEGVSMEGPNVCAARLFPKDNPFVAGHRACQGCAEALAVRIGHQVLGRNTIVASATGCMEIISSSYPTRPGRFPGFTWPSRTPRPWPPASNPAARSSCAREDCPKERSTVVGMGGDGGTADIGMQALSGALERGHDMIYVCYDNEAYMNTGIQRSSSTPVRRLDHHIPAGKQSIGQHTWKKNLPMIVAAHNIPYVATANPSYPFDLIAEGPRRPPAHQGPGLPPRVLGLPHGLADAPNWPWPSGGWPCKPACSRSTRSRTASYTHHWSRPQSCVRSEDYLKPQGRFRHLDEDLDEIEERVTPNTTSSSAAAASEN